MSRKTGSIPNMVNGVSQQPANLRLATQAEICENALCSVVEGLGKRPPSKHRTRLHDAGVGEVFSHPINRDASERYILEITDGDLKVFDISGAEKTVLFPNGKDYLTNLSAKRGFRAVTVADYTFIVNRAITTAMKTTTSAALEERAVFWVKQGAYSTNYELSGGFGSSGYQTPHAENPGSAKYITTDKIVEVINTHLDFVKASSGSVSGTPLTSLTSPYVVSAQGSIISIEDTGGSLGQVDVSDGIAGAGLKLIYKTVRSVADLPEVCVHGHRVEIIGSEGKTADNYWVIFETNDGAPLGSGKWIECLAPGVQTEMDEATLPHQLVRNADGTFTFGPTTWDGRGVGDDESNPVPSFIGNPLNNVVFFSNRLGFLSGENAVFSTTGGFFDFFRATVTTFLDTDPIDIAVSHNKVSILEAAVPVNKRLLLFSAHTQFVLDTQGKAFTLDNVSILPITEFENTPDAVSPVSNGSFVYFATESGENAGLLEYFIADGDSAAPTDAAEITAHVPSYIPKGIHTLASSSNDDILAILTDGAPSTLFMYQFYWSRNDKLQSAHHKWDFGGAVINSAFFIGSLLYVILERADGVYLESIDVSEGQSDEGLTYLVNLDRRLTEGDCTITYDAASNRSTVTLPYAEAGRMELVIRPNSPVGTAAQSLTHTQPTPSTIEVAGDLRSTLFYVGRSYCFHYRPSTVVARERLRGGGDTVVAEGRLQLVNMTLVFDQTAYFTVDVTPLHRETSTYQYTGKIIGDGSNLLGSLTPDSGTFTFMILSKNDQVIIDIKNDTFLPSRFLSAGWTGDLTNRS